MARHVFQYSQWETPLGCYCGDPYQLPPLRPLPEEIRNITASADYERPARADEAGISSLENDYARSFTGAAHRQQALLQHQQQQLFGSTNTATINNNTNSNNNNIHNNPAHATATVITTDPTAPPLAQAVIIDKV
jgi:hypothetical protein